MAIATAIIASRRLQPPVAAILCLMAAQLVNVSLSGCQHEQPLPMGAVRVALPGSR
jgi:hypothetical protein